MPIQTGLPAQAKDKKTYDSEPGSGVHLNSIPDEGTHVTAIQSNILEVLAVRLENAADHVAAVWGSGLAGNILRDANSSFGRAGVNAL